MTAEDLSLVDTHCHLDCEPLAASVDAVLARARAAGVTRCLSVGTSVASSRALVAIAGRYAMVGVGVGVHPEAADTVTDAAMAEIEALCSERGVLAVGEVGLDDYRNPIPLEIQCRALTGFVRLARRARLPLVLHCRGREAYAALIRLLEAEGKGGIRGVIHCASGPPAFIGAALRLGCYISFAGNVTFPNAQALRDLVALVPDDRLLIETDAPFLAPQAVRGRPNEPAYVAHTAAFLAALRGMTVQAFGEMTSRNAQQLFAWKATTA